jgi:hypothetical protein
MPGIRYLDILSPSHSDSGHPLSRNPTLSLRFHSASHCTSHPAPPADSFPRRCTRLSPFFHLHSPAFANRRHPHSATRIAQSPPCRSKCPAITSTSRHHCPETGAIHSRDISKTTVIQALILLVSVDNKFSTDSAFRRPSCLCSSSTRNPPPPFQLSPH